MKLFGTLKETVALWMRQNGFNIKLTPNPATTYDADRTAKLPNQNADCELVSTDATQTLTNKSIDSDTNTITNIVDADIKANAAIARSKLAAGTANHVLINSADGEVFSEAQLATSRGGTGINSTATYPASGVVVTRDAPETLINKTIDADNNALSNILITSIKTVAESANTFISRDGTGAVISTKTVPTGNVVGVSDTQTLTNKTLTSPKLNEDVALTATSSELNQLDGVAVGGSDSGDIVTIDDTQTLTGKTIDGNDNTIQDVALTSLKTVLADASKFVVRDAAGAIVSNTKAVPTGVVVGTTDTQELTNKTLTSPKVNEDVILTASATELNQLDGVTVGGATAGDIVTIDDAQVLTNKDIDGGTASDTSRLTIPKHAKANLDALDRKEATLVYATDTQKAYIDDGSQLVEVGSGSASSSGINYIENPDAENDLIGWSHYDDGASAIPVDGTDEAGATDLTLSRNTTTPLRGVADFMLAKAAADAQGEGISYDFTIDRADVNKQLWISFDVDATDANYTAGDLTVYIIKDTGGTPTLVTPGYTSIAKAKYEFTTYFNADDNTNYRLCIHVAGTTKSAWTGIYFDNFKVGPEELIQGVAVSEWQNFRTNPTLRRADTGADIGNYTVNFAQYRRVGEMAHIRAKFTSTADSSVGQQLGIMFSDFTITGENTESVGTMFFDRGASDYNYICFYTTDFAAMTPCISIHDSTNSSVMVCAEFDIGDFFMIDIMVKIAEWAGSSVGLSNSRVEYLSNSAMGDVDDNTGANTVIGPYGSPFPGVAYTSARAKVVTTLTPIQPTDTIAIQIKNHATNGIWVNYTGADFRTDSGDIISPYNYAGTYGFGRWDIRASNKIGIYFGRYSTGTTAWDETTDDIRWRVVKSSNPLSIGMPTVYKWQTKYLSANVNSTTNPVTDLTFTLESGKTYRISGVFRLNSTDGTYAYVRALDGANTVGFVNFDAGTQADDDGNASLGYSVIYTMVGTSLTFQFVEETTGNLLGDGTKDATWVQVEELPYHVQTTGW